ncbi:dipeptidyl peptidase 4-like isoform X6 [Haliotis cracherodii]|uniref:dipeptidyl peptidase 4-like isoform X6 n=1 Tax=Haliotis cracherodii TaxID=6455 RepID=UPI0039E96346
MRTKVSSGRRYEQLDMEDGGNRRLMDEEELVGNAASQRNWRGIAIALLVIVVVCSLIITAVVLLSPGNENVDLGEKFTIDDFFDPSFKPKTFAAHWQDGEDKFIYRNVEGALAEFDCVKNSSNPLMDNTTFRQLDTGQYSLSPDKKYVLLKSEVEPVYRHSTLASYSVYDINTRVLTKLEGPGAGSSYQYVAWAPKGHSLLMIQKNNIYYKSDIESSPTPVVEDGIPGLIYNGVPDWVYEEEILGADNAVWWSANGTYLCYAVFNDTDVPEYKFPIYGDMNSAYGETKKIAYPKPGFPNPTFKLKIVNIETKVTKTIQPPQDFQNIEYYFTTITWKDDDSLLVSWLNRPQNFSIITKCTAKDAQCQESLREQGHGGWLDLYTTPVFSSDGSRYFWVLPQRDQDAGYFKHVAMVESRVRNTGDSKIFLTLDQSEVTKILSYDNEQKLVYFLGNGGDPKKKHVYSVDHDRKVNCVTCDLDEKCQYVSASFSGSSRYFILECLGPGVPYYALYDTSSLEEIARMENNTILGERLSKKALPRQEDIFIEIENGEKIWGKMLLPPKMKKEEITTYPLILNVYGGPGTQKVTDEFSIGWETYLTSSKDYIYAYADGRGSGGRGQTFLQQIYKRLGTVEVDDAIKAGEHYSKLHYVDTEKMAIWGWSYGGFLTLSALGRGTETFPCGIAVAPVTDWIYYDSVYTERYMGTPRPSDNRQAYRDANVSHYAERMKKTKFMLVHGTGDDNVHFQHSAQLMKALTEANVYFRLQVYTDKHHGLLGGNTRRHLYETLEDFLVECFDGRSLKFGKPPKLDEEKKEST